nr:MAG TPA: hypothetical protein [Bacteriophage sp.]
MDSSNLQEEGLVIFVYHECQNSTYYIGCCFFVFLIS